MPELPEVESVRRGLSPRLVGARVSSMTLHRADIVTGATAPAALLGGATIAALDRRGKQLAIIAASGRVLLVHMGMSGQLFWQPRGTPANTSRTTHVHARWALADARGATTGELVFRDPRRFGGLWTFASVADLHTHWLALGPDALTISPDHLAASASATRRAIKPVLLDQRVLAGVGNIYADEALHAARIHPLRLAHRLKPAELERLAATVRAVLQSAINAGGSTLRDYVNADGAPGGFAAHHAVYGRAGLPCFQCSTPLRADVVAQRTTVWCRVCQPKRSRG